MSCSKQPGALAHKVLSAAICGLATDTIVESTLDLPDGRLGSVRPASMLICQHPGEEGGEEAEGRHLGRQQAARRRAPCARAGEMSGRTAV